ncbi:hypothetical protein HJC23_001244 [Cyclotella cryptica]|uniref:Uncharacterized protein n=1 Tax=Cyclotella cryptica TaxID=29204 RepID=A0ABD3NU44_9STRA|eukprot:CCRYP_019912-RA/>CCRYP_019912-RA protein AED:0.23 eAED:0.23 QI:0/-1/0/1/-1/1/1/0/750
MNEYHDPLSRGPKGHPHISSQPLPPHPDSSADDTVFRPTFECSQPMFPDASFDLSTNKSSTSNSHRRPLQSPHMTPPPLPPNTPSMYTRNSLPPPLPTTVHRSNARWDDPIPPSPMQIIMSRQSTSTSQQSGREGSHPREAREPQHHDVYYQSPGASPYSNNPYNYVSALDREEREPPPIAQRQFSPGYDGQIDPYDHPGRDSYARNEPQRNNRYDSHPDEFHLQNNSSETHPRCNCENCRRCTQPYNSRCHDDRDRCLHHSSRHQHYHQEPHFAQQRRDDHKQHVNHSPGHGRHPYGHSSEYGNVNYHYDHEAREPAPSHDVQDGRYIQTDRRKHASDLSPGHYGNYSHDNRRRPLSTSNEQQYRNGYENERDRRAGFDGRQSRGRSHERGKNTHHHSNGYHDGDDRRMPPPNTPTSPLSLSTLDERPPSRQAWSPKSDNATLHVETTYVPQYVTSSSDKNAPEVSRRDHDARNSNGYPSERMDYVHHHDRMHFDSRGSHHRGQERGEPVNTRYADERQRRDQKHYDDRGRYQPNDNQRHEHNTHYTNERPNQPAHYNGSNVPTQVSYSSHESQRERRYKNTSPDCRDDYSGSTIPTHSTVNPGPHNRGHYDNQEPRQHLRVDIPVSPIVPANIQQSSYVQGMGNHHNDTYQNSPPNTSRSSGYQPTSSAPSYHNHPPITSRSDPMDHSQRPDTRVAIAERERQKSEARHQIMKEIHQATNMRNSAIDENDRRFWDRQIATLNESFKQL